MTTTLSTMMTYVRNRTDQQDSDFLGDAELITYLQDSYSGLYDLVVDKDIYFFVTASFTVAAPNNTFDLPSDFYLLKGMNVFVGNQPWTLGRFNYNDRNERFIYGMSAYNYPQTKVEYDVVGQQIWLIPDIAAAGIYRLDYYPMLTPLTSPSQAIDSQFDGTGWWIWACLDTCLKVREKAEMDVGTFPQELERMQARILQKAPKRDNNKPVCLDRNRGNVTIYDPMGLGLGSWRR